MRRKTNAFAPWRRRLHEVIFEADTVAGKAFDVALLVVILMSTVVAMLESVQDIDSRFHHALWVAEWVFTLLFTVEYVLRLVCVRQPLSYALSFFGLVDFLAVLPTYLSLFIPGSQALVVIRTLRLLRVFLIFKMTRYMQEARNLLRVLRQSAAKITVFLAAVLIVVTIMGSVMYLVEGRQQGFTSIPQSTYWAIVTLTTVGFGDVAPATALGKALAAVLMVLGYSLIIVPMGIVGAGLTRTGKGSINTQSCTNCSLGGHESDSKYCRHCGATL